MDPKPNENSESTSSSSSGGGLGGKYQLLQQQFMFTQSAIDDLPSTPVQSIPLEQCNISGAEPPPDDEQAFIWKEFKQHLPPPPPLPPAPSPLPSPPNNNNKSQQKVCAQNSPLKLITSKTRLQQASRTKIQQPITKEKRDSRESLQQGVQRTKTTGQLVKDAHMVKKRTKPVTGGQSKLQQQHATVQRNQSQQTIKHKHNKAANQQKAKKLDQHKKK